ncbi:MAG: T9SS type A sorting domain-containing protein, partial [Ignavibacteria bacterium]
QVLKVIDNNLFAGTFGNGIFTSSNNGESWNAYGLTNNWVMAIGNHENSIIAGTNDGISISTNNGNSWGNLRSDIIKSTVWSIEIKDSNFFAGTEHGIFHFKEVGNNWSLINSGLTDNWVFSIVVSDKNIFAGTDHGIFLSSNQGENWNTINTGLLNYGIPAVVLNNKYLFVGTDGSGVWRRPLSEITDVGKVENKIPTQFLLAQNYPNPFNPSTTISFSIPAESFITLKIYDLLGKEIATIVSGELSAGSYKRIWNAENYASGIYFYRLQAGNFTETKKLILMK